MSSQQPKLMHGRALELYQWSGQVLLNYQCVDLKKKWYERSIIVPIQVPRCEWDLLLRVWVSLKGSKPKRNIQQISDLHLTMFLSVP